MANWLILTGAVGALLAIIGLLILAVMFANDRHWFWACCSLGGIAVIVFAAILGDMYAMGGGDR